MHLGPIADADADAVRATVELNLIGTFLCIKHAVPFMGGGGSIVGMSSGAGHFPHRHLWAYGMAKAGIEMLVRYAAEELAESGIRVNAVQPGIIDDELMAFITAGGPLFDDYMAQTPISRPGTVPEVAERRPLPGRSRSGLDHRRVPGRGRRSPPAPGRQLRAPARRILTAAVPMRWPTSGGARPCLVRRPIRCDDERVR